MAAVTAQPYLARRSYSGSVEYLGGIDGSFDDQQVEMEDRKPVRTVKSVSRYEPSVEEIRGGPLCLEKFESVKTFVLHQEINSKEGEFTGGLHITSCR